MMIINSVKEFSVDAGNISVIDNIYLKKKGGEFNNNLNKAKSIDPGKYKVKFEIDCWDGNITKEEIIETEGLLIFGDLCYLFNDHTKWINFLDETDYLEKNNENFFSLFTGGDGNFITKINIEKVE